MLVYPAFHVGVTATRLANTKLGVRAATALILTCLTSLTCLTTSAFHFSYEEIH
jgi:hypothetical protein